jgi:tetratricopeptide (TPR) repeat protein
MDEPTATKRDLSFLAWPPALVCAVAVLFAKWVNFPLSNQLRGLHFSLLGYLPDHAGSPLTSYGTLAAILFLAAAYAFHTAKTRMLAAMGSALLLIALWTLLQVALVDAAMFKRLADEIEQLHLATFFSRYYLPANLGNEPSVWILVEFDTIWSRLITGWTYLGFGWYATLAGGAVIFLNAVKRLASKGGVVAAVAATSIALAAVCSMPYWLSELAVNRAIAAESAGHLDEAIRQYRRAIRICRWNRVNLDLYARIGAIDSTQGRTATLEYGIYHAELEASKSDLPSAIAEFEDLAARAGPIAGILRSRAAGLLTQYGAGLYEAAAFGAAIDAWHQALAQDSTMWLAAYYLTRGCFAARRYQESVDLSKRLVEQMSDPMLIANLYNNLGDAYTELGALAEAHRAYRYAWKLDYKMNFRSVSALVGP